jgi:hypothetical protein
MSATASVIDNLKHIHEPKTGPLKTLFYQHPVTAPSYALTLEFFEIAFYIFSAVQPGNDRMQIRWLLGDDHFVGHGHLPVQCLFRKNQGFP